MVKLKEKLKEGLILGVSFGFGLILIFSLV